MVMVITTMNIITATTFVSCYLFPLWAEMMILMILEMVTKKMLSGDKSLICK